jgi:hypothetical protein
VCLWRLDSNVLPQVLQPWHRHARAALGASDPLRDLHQRYSTFLAVDYDNLHDFISLSIFQRDAVTHEFRG